jgi:hypothetical protein
MRIPAALLALGAVLSAQEKLEPFPRVDPYTKNAREKFERAGYVSLGPFRFGDDHTTAQVETTLAGVPLLWVETEHFRIGSGLPEYELTADKAEKERLKGELEALATRLPDVKVKLKKLDPWMRLHLLALRFETLYADFLRHCGLRASEFPQPGADAGNGSMGRGPYLGMGGKFTVLVFASKSHLARYGAAYLGARVEAPVRKRFAETDAWFFATAAEFVAHGQESDTALACDLAAHVAQNLAFGLRGGRGDLPFALEQGLGHWFARRVDPRYPVFAGSDPARLQGQSQQWETEVRSRAEHKVFPTSLDMLGWEDPDTLEWADHIVLWSRIDYLFAREDGAGGQLLRRLQEPLDPAAPPLDARTRAERAHAALEAAVGVPLAAFDEAWSAWVLKTYR